MGQKTRVFQFDKVRIGGREVEVNYTFGREYPDCGRYAHLANGDDISAYQDEADVIKFVGLDSRTGMKCYEQTA